MLAVIFYLALIIPHNKIYFNLLQLIVYTDVKIHLNFKKGFTEKLRKALNLLNWCGIHDNLITTRFIAVELPKRGKKGANCYH